MSPMVLPPPISKDRMIGLAASFFLHTFLFVGGGLVLMQPAQYAVEAGSGGMEAFEEQTDECGAGAEKNGKTGREGIL